MKSGQTSFKDSLSAAGRDRPALGVISRTTAVEIIEMYGYAGFEFVVIDGEHGPLTWVEIQQHIRAAEAAGITPIVRTPDDSESSILKCLDAGAAGIVVPHVNNAAAARKIAKAARYAPDGSRGQCPYVRAARYGGIPWTTYKAQSNRDVLVIALLEEGEAVANLDEILDVPGIDVMWIGQGDMSASMGLRREDPKLEEIARDIIARCRRKGIGTAIVAPTAEAAALRAEQGVRLILCGNEGNILLRACQDRYTAWDKAAKAGTVKTRSTAA